MVHDIKTALGVGVQTGADLTAALVARSRFARSFELDFQKHYEIELDPSAGRAELEEVILDRVDAKLTGVLDGSVEGPLTWLYRSLLGTDTITTPAGGVNSRDHTITLSDALTSNSRLSLEKKVGTRAQAFNANGVVRMLECQFNQQGMLRHSFEALCGKPSTAASTAVTLPGLATRLSRRMGTFTLFGLADNTLKVRGGSWRLERVLDDEDFTATSLFRRDAEYGELRATWEAQVLYEDEDQVKRMWGGTGQTDPKDTAAYYAAKFKFEHPTVIEGVLKYGVTADFPRSSIQVTKPQRAKNVILQTIRGTATYDASTTKAVDIVIRNTLVS